MATVATLSRTWIKRQLVIGGVTFGIAIWFFWDGAVTYPKSNERFRAHQNLVQQNREDAWPAYAKERDWKEQPPEKEYRIADQYVLGTAMILASLSAFALLAFSWKRRVTSDEEAMTGSNGLRVPFADVVSTDRRKWDRKGIAYALYQTNGKPGRLKIDDYKYEHAELILLQAEENLAARTEPTPPAS